MCNGWNILSINLLPTTGAELKEVQKNDERHKDDGPREVDKATDGGDGDGVLLLSSCLILHGPGEQSA